MRRGIRKLCAWVASCRTGTAVTCCIVEFDRDPAVVTMYDGVGKKVLEARMAPPDAGKVSIGSARATRPEGFLRLAEGP